MRATKLLYSEIDKDGKIVADRIYLTPGVKLPEGHRWVLYTPPISEKKINKKEYINTKRNYRCTIPVVYLTKEWQADKRSAELLNNAILLDYLDIMPAPSIWRSLDNTNIEVTLQDLKNIAALIAANTQEAYTKSWQLKDSIDSATTTEEISVITW